MKTDFMPLWFQFSPQPDQGKRCDLPDCIILEDTPWKIFEGCWHSFHLSCLDVVDVCPICRTGIETAMKSLATIANKSALPRENTGGGDNTGGMETAAGNDDDENDEREGQSTSCACQWCSRQLQTNTNPSFPSLSQGPSVVRETHISPDVTEWLISVSQSTVTPGQMGSNACTVIAVYGAVNFLLPSTNWILPSPHSLPLEFISVFKQLMIYGNQSYNWLGNQQPTYSAPEIINHPQLGFSGVVNLTVFLFLQMNLSIWRQDQIIPSLLQCLSCQTNLCFYL